MFENEKRPPRRAAFAVYADLSEVHRRLNLDAVAKVADAALGPFVEKADRTAFGSIRHAVLGGRVEAISRRFYVFCAMSSPRVTT